MFRNVASQKLAVLAWDGAAGEAKTGDALNITAQISLDGGACAASDDENPTELDATNAPGVYIFDMDQAETDANLVVFQAASSTSNIIFRPLIIYTETVIPTATEIVAAIQAMIIEGTLTLQQVMTAILAKSVGDGSGGGTTTLIYKNQAGDTNRITMTVSDEDGNRTVSLDFSDL